MLRMHQTVSVKAAKSYYAAGLAMGDYFQQGHESPGYWQGKAARLLGLHGKIERDDFDSRCDNVRPDTGKRLNPRQDVDRRVGMDVVFSAPKSVSILHGVLGDSRIPVAFQTAVRDTMEQIEEDAFVRVRLRNQVAIRRTSNLLWGEFVHYTSRQVDGLCDPQLHIHAYTFQSSYDEVEQRFKAGEFYHIRRNAPYYEAVFHSHLAHQLTKLGYQIDNRAFSFEVKGVGDENIQRFSRRAQEIDALAETLGIADNDKAKDGLAAKTRKSKSNLMSEAEMKAEWRDRIDHASLSYERTVLAEPPKMTAKQAVDLAIEGGFERKSVAEIRRLVAEALRISCGSCSVEAIEHEMRRRGAGQLVTHIDTHVAYATTHAIIEEEKAILSFLESTRRTVEPLASDGEITNTQLDPDQRAAVMGLWQSKDRVYVILGKAGTGKTTLMRQAVDTIEAGGHQVYTFAPTSEASHNVLTGEGFAKSHTVQQLLVNQTLQAEVAGAVLWIDEAGLLSSPELRKLVDIAETQNARLVFSGDTSQHHSVERGDGLRLIVQSGMVTVSETREIHRQQKASYREAVRLISEGKVDAGFQGLAAMGAIEEFDKPELKVRAIAEDYARSLKKHDTVLVVSPTHREAEMVTQAIRERLREDGLLHGEDQDIPTLYNRNLTKAERRLSNRYRVGDVIKFHQNAGKGFRKGEHYHVTHLLDDGTVEVESATQPGITRTLDFAAAKHYQLYESRTLPLAIGDRVRLSQNSQSVEGKRLYNGSVHKITGFTQDGDVVLKSGHTMSKDSGVLAHGYVATSHGSQGKTSGKLILSQSQISSPAASMEQFYVSVSRGRHEIAIYTDNKQALMESVRFSGKRMLATELSERRELAPVKTDTSFSNLLANYWHRLTGERSFGRGLMHVIRDWRNGLHQQIGGRLR